MKTTLKYPFILIILTGMLSVFSAKAQDPVKAAPGMYQKVILDNDKVRVIEVLIKQGEEVPWHSHPNHVAYVISGGKLEMTAKGKAPEIVDMPAGQAMYMDAVTHMAKNVGTTDVKAIIIEMKQ
jgi:quercetin dioxygenase-like cupin family protein